MTSNDYLLLGILAMGVILINWNTIKKDFFFQAPSKTTKPAPENKASPVKQKAHLQL
jgi:hypothetical protein